MTDERFRLRYNRYRKLIGSSPILQHGSDYQQESLLRAAENAHRLLHIAVGQGFRFIAGAEEEL